MSGDSRRRAKEESPADQPARARHHHADDVAALAAEGDTKADVLRLARDSAGEQSEEANRHQQRADFRIAGDADDFVGVTLVLP